MMFCDEGTSRTLIMFDLFIKRTRAAGFVLCSAPLTSCRLVFFLSVCCSPANSVLSCTESQHRHHPPLPPLSRVAGTPCCPHERSWPCSKRRGNLDVFISLNLKQMILLCIMDTTWPKVCGHLNRKGQVQTFLQDRKYAEHTTTIYKH